MWSLFFFFFVRVVGDVCLKSENVFLVEFIRARLGACRY